MSTSGRYHEYIGGYHEYIGGCSVHWGNTMSTSGGYHDAYLLSLSVLKFCKEYLQDGNI